MKKKNKGSAIILAILLLAFFMALTLSMYFMAEKKSERAGIKSRGTKVLSSIDSGSSIAYYELSFSNHLRMRGLLDREQNFVIKNGVFNDANGPTEVKISGGGTEITPIQAIMIANYYDYFGSAMVGDYTRKTYAEPDILFTTISRLAVNVNNQVTYLERKINPVDPSQNGHEGLITNLDRLWDYNADERISIGGYKLVNKSVSTMPSGGKAIKANYTKSIILNPVTSSSPTKLRALGEFKYNIDVREDGEVDVSGNINISEVVEIIVEKQK